MNKMISKWIPKIAKPKFLIAAGLIGILLIALSGFVGKPKTEVKENSGEFSAEQYKKDIEDDLKKMVCEITGDRKAKVVVTLESSVKYSYADTKEEIVSDKSSDTGESSENELKAGYITVRTADGGEEALLVTAQMPDVRGVAIVCDGGDNEILNEKLQNTVTAALNITKKRVYICGRNLQ